MAEVTEKSFPFDAEEINGEYDRTYLADDFAQYFRAFISSGVFMAESTNLQVIENGDMTVTLKPGQLIIDGYRYDNLGDIIIPLDPADGVLNRIDRISATWSKEDKDIHYTLQKGVPSYEPVPNGCRRNEDTKDYVLADVYVKAGAISILQKDITDQRLNSEICGVANPFNKIDTTSIFMQFTSWLEITRKKGEEDIEKVVEYMEGYLELLETSGDNQLEELLKSMREFINNSEDEFGQWFKKIKDQLSEDAAGHLQNQLSNLEINVDKIETPDFDDTGEVEGIGSFTDFMSSFVKGTSIYQLFANLKAGLEYVLHAGQLVNNGLCEDAGQYPLDAAYGKVLTDQITGLGGFEPIIDDTGKITGYKTTIGGADTVFPFSEIDKNALLEALSASGLNITADSTPEEIYDKLSAAIFIPQGQIWPDSLANEYSWSVSFSFGGERWGWSSNYGDTYTQTVTFTLKKDGSLYSRSSISYSGDNFYTNYISSYSKAIESLPSVLKSYPLKGSFSKGLSVSGYKSSGSGTLSINFANKLCTITESFSVSGNDGKPAVDSWEKSFAWPQTYMGKVSLL